MSKWTYDRERGASRPLVWLADGIRTPPFSPRARIEAGWLLRRLQEGERLPMPHSRPMPAIGRRCHELRVSDGDVDWRIFYRTDSDAVIVLDIVRKDRRTTRRGTIASCRARLQRYDEDRKGDPR